MIISLIYLNRVENVCVCIIILNSIFTLEMINLVCGCLQIFF